MHFKNLASVATALAVGSIQVAAITHGEVEDYNGGQIKWHQVGKDAWSGVPLDEWDDSIHQRSDVDFGFGQLDIRGLDPRSMSHGLRTEHELELDIEDRDLEAFCQAVVECAWSGGTVALAGAMAGFLVAFKKFSDAAGGVWTALNEKAFVTTVAGGTIATIAGISGEKLLNPPAEQCSTKKTDFDAIASAIQNIVDSNLGATGMTANVSGADKDWTITIIAVPEGVDPKPVLGMCK